MTWTKVAATATCDLADPGWTNAEAPESPCDLTGTVPLFGWSLVSRSLLPSSNALSGFGWRITPISACGD